MLLRINKILSEECVKKLVLLGGFALAVLYFTENANVLVPLVMLCDSCGNCGGGSGSGGGNDFGGGVIHRLLFYRHGMANALPSKTTFCSVSPIVISEIKPKVSGHTSRARFMEICTRYKILFRKKVPSSLFR